MRIITRKQEEAQVEQQRQMTEKKLRFMGQVVAEEMLRRVGWKDETVPDLGGYIHHMASEISYADNVISMTTLNTEELLELENHSDEMTRYENERLQGMISHEKLRKR